MRHILRCAVLALTAFSLTATGVGTALTTPEPTDQPMLVEVLYAEPAVDLDEEFVELFQEVGGSDGGCSVTCPAGWSCCVASCWWGCCAIACPGGQAASCWCRWGSPRCACTSAAVAVAGLETAIAIEVDVGST